MRGTGKMTSTSEEATYGIKIEKDVDIPLRDGTKLKADVFRPDGAGTFPVIMNLGPYQKDKVWVPPEDLEEKANPLMNWETVNPEWWVPKGYIAVRVDARGTGKSPGQGEPWSIRNRLTSTMQSNGLRSSPGFRSGGAFGHLLLRDQSMVCREPSATLAQGYDFLEGFADLYRDALFHGGLLNQFMTNWFVTHLAHHLIGRAYKNNPDTFQTNTLWKWLRNNLDNGTFRGEQAQWDKITVPFLTAGNWSGMGLHMRGNTEAYMRAASKHKKMRMHAGNHVHPFYTQDGRQDQLKFFDYWLKGIDNGVMDEPPVRLWVRHGNAQGEWRHENEWPLARTEWTKFHFDLSPPAEGEPKNRGGLIRESNPAKTQSRTYFASGAGKAGQASASSTFLAAGAMMAGMGISLDTPPLEQDLEVTGPVMAQLWVSSSTEDMDLFLTIRNIDPDGNDVFEIGQQGQQVPIAKGWLRVSHRELDPDLSLPFRPYHKHKRRLLLNPDEVVPVQVEIWPTSMLFKKGHRIRLDVQPRDGLGSIHYTHYHADYNTGANTIYSGGDRESYLLLPVIPKASV